MDTAGGGGKQEAGAVITSRENLHFKELRKLSASPRERRRRGRCLLEGRRNVETALAAVPLLELVLTPGRFAGGEGAHLLGRYPGARLVLLSEKLFRELTSLTTPPDMMAAVPTPSPPALMPGGDLLLLDGLQDPGNLGMILRSAAAAGAAGVMLSPSCTDPWSPKALRAGMGGQFHLPVVEGRDLAVAAAGFGGEVIVLDHQARDSLFDCDLSGPACFVIGAEGRGVSPSLLEAAGRAVHIPSPGWKEPLNAAAAATVCLFESVRQKGL